MHWNYRVIRHQSISARGEHDCWLAIHEAYYPDDSSDIPNGYTEEPVPVAGEDLEELRWKLERMLEALEKPILDDVD
jgi:hypothetical protein